METLKPIDQAAVSARRNAGIRLDVFARETARNEKGVDRSFDAAFVLLAELAALDVDAAGGFAMAAVMYGMQRRIERDQLANRDDAA